MSFIRHPPKDRTPRKRHQTIGGISKAKRVRYWSKTTALSSVTTASKELFSKLDGWGVTRSSPSMVGFRRMRGKESDEIAISYSHESEEWCAWASWGSSWGGGHDPGDESWRSLPAGERWDKERWEAMLRELIDGFQ